MSISAQTAFEQNPEISIDEFMRLTGLRKRSYYKYRAMRDAQPGESAAPAPRSKRNGEKNTDNTTEAIPAIQPSVDIVKVVTNTAGRTIALGVLFGAATVASVHNMYLTMNQISADAISAITLTAVFGTAGIVFTGAGKTQNITRIVTGLVILFEAFCNATSIYGGLWWQKAAEGGSRFLQMVQAFVWFAQPQHCAVAMALMAAALIAAVQYACIGEYDAAQQTKTKKKNAGKH